MALREENRWSARPRLALSLRAAIVLVPFVLSFVASVVAHRLIADAVPTWHWAVPALLALLPAMVTLMVTERAMRRVLPLVMLLKLSLLFPDQVPSRLGIALRAASPKRLTRTLSSEDPDEAAAAENILTLVAALNAHDRATRGHSERVRAVTMLLADQMKITGVERDKLEWAALLHDLGKMTVDPAILNKNGPPSDEEWHELRRHPAAGAPLARCLEGWLGDWVHAIDQHHERVDGSGYPHGLSGKEISLGGRIVAVSDAFEVMTAVRSYKRALTTSAAREELVKCAGTHFDPVVVRSFMGVSIAHLHKALGPSSWLLSLPFRGLVGQAARVGNALVGGIAPPVLASAAAVVLVSASTVALVGAVGGTGSVVSTGDELSTAAAADQFVESAGQPFATTVAVSQPNDRGPAVATGPASGSGPSALPPTLPLPEPTATPVSVTNLAGTNVEIPLQLPVATDPIQTPVVDPGDVIAAAGELPVVRAVGGVAVPVVEVVGGVAEPVVDVVGGVAGPVVDGVVAPVVGGVAVPVVEVVGGVAEPVVDVVGGAVVPLVGNVVGPVVEGVLAGVVGAGESAPAVAVPLPTVVLPPVVVVPVPSVIAVPVPVPSPVAPVPVASVAPLTTVVSLPSAGTQSASVVPAGQSPLPPPPLVPPADPLPSPTAAPNNVISLLGRLN